ncbi:hypothetical protein B0H17DRAFT_1139967 [Mycena rosella]|uniref:Uncharacterized protein n=1 Tax=Mycena rosella TaxID=1033263 RepID=A0AAD7GBU9_MYCRO|nr:hypothetical protein B0H17DRAFT_1139967 [Mycena rosella]
MRYNDRSGLSHSQILRPKTIIFTGTSNWIQPTDASKFSSISNPTTPNPFECFTRPFESDYRVPIAPESIEAAEPFTAPTRQEQEEEVAYAWNAKSAFSDWICNGYRDLSE